MNITATHARYVLLDAAIVPLADIQAVANSGISAYCLYAALGEEAQRVAPWLLAEATASHALADALRTESKRAHGIAWLHTDADIDVVADHLRTLQRIHADGKYYFLRYADGHAWADVWSVLRPEQRHMALGPIREWRAHAFVTHSFAPPQTMDTESLAHNLRLSRAQWSALLQAQRDTQRGIEWKTGHSVLASQLDGDGLHALSRRTGDWLRAQGPLPPAVIHAVGLAALRSQGRVLDDPAFSEAVRLSNAPAQQKVLRTWGQA